LLVEGFNKSSVDFPTLTEKMAGDWESNAKKCAYYILYQMGRKTLTTFFIRKQRSGSRSLREWIGGWYRVFGRLKPDSDIKNVFSTKPRQSEKEVLRPYPAKTVGSADFSLSTLPTQIEHESVFQA
jgi:hypothetical protein